MHKLKRPPKRHTLFHEKRKHLSHIVWHVATGEWPQEHEVIHHIDEDPFNNELGNLRLMAISEHHLLHTKGKHPSKETRTKMSTSQMGKTLSEKTKARISASMMGSKNPQWLGDSAKKHSKYMRKWNAERRDLA